MTAQTKPTLPPLPELDVGRTIRLSSDHSEFEGVGLSVDRAIKFGRDCFDAGKAQARADLLAELGVVAVVVSKYGDPEAFGEREINTVIDLMLLPYGTALTVLPKA